MFDREIAVAWHQAAMGAAASAGKLKALKHYLPKQPKRAQTPAEMLEVFRAIQARGVPMNIQQVH